MTSMTDRADADRSGPGGASDWRDRRLTRGDDRKIAGVASGIADYFDIDPTLVRLGFVVSLVVTVGMSLLAYLILWLVLPTNDGESVVQGGARDQSTLMIVLGLVVVVLFAGAVGDIGNSLFDGGIVLPVILIVAGVVLLRQRSVKSHASTDGHGSASQQRRSPNVDGSDADVDHVVSEEGAMHASDSDSGSGSGGLAPGAPTNEKPPRAPKTPIVITPVVISLMMIAAGVGLGLELTGAANVKLGVVAGVWLLLVAGGLFVATVRGRAPGLIAVGVIAAISLMVASVVDPILEDGTGERTHTVNSIAELQPSYRLGAGEMTVDLSGLELNGETRTVNIELAVGHLVVRLPSGPALQLDVENTAGELVFRDGSFARRETTSGWENDYRVVDPVGDGLLIVTVKNRYGQVEVTRFGDRGSADAPSPVPPIVTIEVEEL